MTLASEAEARAALGLMTSITDEERTILNMLLPRAEASICDHIGYDPVQREDTEFYPRSDAAGGYGGVGRGVWDVDSSHRSAQLYPVGGPATMFPTLQLERLPIRAITDVWVDYEGRYGSGDDAFNSGTKLTEGSDYWAEYDRPQYAPTGCIFRRTAWPIEPGTVKVTYRAGYSPDELAGRARATATAADGTITVARVNASALKAACLANLTAAMQKWAALKKSATGWKPGGLSSEKLGDYSYTVGGAAAENIASLRVEMTGTAIDLCEPFIHYGAMRL